MNRPSRRNPTLTANDLEQKKNQAFGVLGLDATGKAPAAQMPNTDSIGEGAGNLYFTPARADARVPAAIGAAAVKTAPADTDKVAIVEGPTTLRHITVADLKAGKLRTGVFQHEHCNNLTNFTSLHTRQLDVVTVKPTRAWLHLRNWDQLGAAWGAGTLTNVIAAVGPPSFTNGEWNGQCSAVPTQILAGGTLTNTELVVPVPVGTYQFTPNTPFVTQIGWTCGTPQPVANGGGMHYFTNNPNDALVAAPAGLTRVDNQGFLDFYWEFEYANDGVPTILVVGNSLSAGGNVANLANRGILDAWHYQWAIGNGGMAASLAVGGSWCNQFGAASPRWNAYDGLVSGSLNPDWVVLMAPSSSDIASGTSLATAQADFTAAVAKAKAMWSGAQMMGTTLPPRVATTAATEVVRKQFNAWVTGTPAGLNRCMDIEPLLTDGGAQMALSVSAATVLTLNGDRIPRLHPDADSGDHEHWRPRASGRIGDLFNLARKAVA